uniref:HMG box domain-containing protein n=1 Tax=Panagrolaimus davidi TaxID=227884 RepID=A0A914P3R9_9BILA
MFRAIVNFRIGALIQSNVIGRNYASKPSNSKPSKEVLQYRYLPDKPWILFLGEKMENADDFSSPEAFKRASKLWKVTDKEPYIYESRKILEKTQSNVLSASKEEQENILKLQVDIPIKTEICKEYEDQFFKDTNRPCAPIEPHEMYFQEKHPGKSRRNAKYAKDEFDKLSDEEKQPFIDTYNEECKSYFIALKKWEEIHGEAYKLIKKETEKMLQEIKELKEELIDYYYKYKDDLQN